MPADARLLFNLKCILRSFSDSTGLHVNFQKSFTVPINIDNSKLLHLASTFGCGTGKMSFTYLGLPLGINKPTTQDFAPTNAKI